MLSFFKASCLYQLSGGGATGPYLEKFANLWISPDRVEHVVWLRGS
jgi:hypothetical protein